MMNLGKLFLGFIWGAVFIGCFWIEDYAVSDGLVFLTAGFVIFSVIALLVLFCVSLFENN